MEERKKRRGDRYDGYILKDEVPSLNRFMAYLFPNRTDCEARLGFEFDTRPIDAFLAKKNEGRTEDKYTYFHVLMAAMVKCVVLRPKMNRFIAGNRIYQRKDISVSFVVKKKFDDKAEEGLAFKKYGPEDTVDTLHESIMKEIRQCRREDVKDSSTGTMDTLMKLPHGLLKIVTSVLLALDRNGRVPYDLIKADPNYSSIFLTNLGSIGLQSGYHHLNNWGTNSFFAVIGKKHLAPEWHEDGSCEVRSVIGVDFTLDERIADGLYYAKTVSLLQKMLQNPELLEQPFSTPIE